MCAAISLCLCAVYAHAHAHRCALSHAGGAAQAWDPEESTGEQAIISCLCEGAVQPNEHRDGCQSGQAPRQWVDAGALVEAGRLKLQGLRLVGVARLQLLDTWCNGLHCHGRLHLRTHANKKRRSSGDGDGGGGGMLWFAED